MEDRQLLLAEEEYAGTREMLRRVGVLAVVDASKSFTITAVGEVKARLDKLICYYFLDTTTVQYDVLAGAVPKIPPGATVWLLLGYTNIGNIAGTLFVRATDMDTNTVLFEVTVGPKNPGEYGEGSWSPGVMPTHDWRILVEVGH